MSYKEEYKKLDLKQNAIKILINAFYGAFGNKYFYFHNTDIAQSITLQGQDLIKYTIEAINHYFRNKWHLDVELHKILGVDDRVINKINTDAFIYCDTDSSYICFDYAIESIEGLEVTHEEGVKMCIAICQHRLNGYFKEVHDKYAKHFNTVNRQEFKLENVSQYGIFLMKKNYILYVCADGDTLLDKPYIISKGLETQKGSWPIWARERLMKLYKLMLDRGPKINIEEELIPVLQAYRDEMELLPVDEIGQTFNLTEYDKYVVSDYPLILEKGTTYNVRAASYYNYMLKHNKGSRYTPIRAGSKIRIYCVNPIENELPLLDSIKYPLEAFAYVPGEFPEEFAPPIDRKQQFFIIMIKPINRLLTAMGLSNLDENLRRSVKLTHTKSKKVKPIDDWLPAYAVNTETYESTAIPDQLSRILVEPILNGGEPADIPNDLFPEYLNFMSLYGLNTMIVPKFDLEKQIKKLKDKKAKAEAKALASTEDEESDE